MFVKVRFQKALLGKSTSTLFTNIENTIKFV
jgi:hypothetical protein